MESITDIPVYKTQQSRLPGFDFANINFGRIASDHMFVAEYKDGEWQHPRIEQFQPLTFSPMALGLHYGQTVFEGFKAFRMNDGRVNVFRPMRHYERMLRSMERMCMPAVPAELYREGLHKLIDLDRDWIPQDPDGSLYIRPFVIATEEKLGVKVSDEYLFLIVTTPVGKYYSHPLKVKVEMEFSRAAEGGTGEAKCGGNYGAAFYPTVRANREGFDQVLWTDSCGHQYIEESGTMNIMFFIDNKLITPSLDGNILAGVTRDSLLTLARDMGIETEERKVSIHELRDAFRAGAYVEAFGAGTAAVVAPIEMIDIEGEKFYPQLGENTTMNRLKKGLSEIRHGLKEDTYGWNYIVG